MTDKDLTQSWRNLADLLNRRQQILDRMEALLLEVEKTLTREAGPEEPAPVKGGTPCAF